jgi:hypothetical protein
MGRASPESESMQVAMTAALVVFAESRHYANAVAPPTAKTWPRRE